MKTSKINMNATLDEAIVYLESKRERELIDLKNQVDYTIESLKPINLLNDTIASFTGNSETKQSILESILSISGGYFSKKLIMGKSNSFIKKILGYVLQYGVTSFISKKVSD